MSLVGWTSTLGSSFCFLCVLVYIYICMRACVHMLASICEGVCV